jgi:hypothetical protein
MCGRRTFSVFRLRRDDPVKVPVATRLSGGDKAACLVTDAHIANCAELEQRGDEAAGIERLECATRLQRKVRDAHIVSRCRERL